MARTTQQYGVTLSYLDPNTPGVLLYGVAPDNSVIPLQIDEHGVLNSNVTLIGDIVVGSFVIQDPSTSRKANVIFDGTNSALVVTADLLPLPTNAAQEDTLQAIGSYIESLIGQKPSAESVPVVIASDQSPIPVTFSGLTITIPSSVTVNNFPANQTISGTVTALIEDSSGNPLTSTSGSLNVNVTSGSGIQSVIAASSSGLTINGSISVLNFPANQTISGTVNVNQPVAVLASSTTGVTANISGTVNVQASSVSGLTINGEITADQGIPNLLVNAWPVKITDGVFSPVISSINPSGSESALVVRNIPSGVQNTSEIGFSTPNNIEVLVSNSISTQVLAANSSRRYAYVMNQSGSDLFIALGTNAVPNQGILLSNGLMYEILTTNLWLGTVTAISASSSGNVTISVFEGTL